MYKHVAGIGNVEMTPEEEAAWLAESEANDPATNPTPTPVSPPILYSVAQIAIADGEITGFEVNSKLAGGFVLDVGMYYMFFAEPQPDTKYLAKAYDGGLVRAYVDQNNKFEDGFIISVIDAAGDPVDVPNLSLEIIRVN